MNPRMLETKLYGYFDAAPGISDNNKERRKEFE